MPATIKEAVEELSVAVDAGSLDAKDHDFAISLCEFFHRHGRLSDKQLYWVRKLTGKAAGTEPVPAPHTSMPKVTVDTMAFDAKPLREIFDKASEKLKYPSITLSGIPITGDKMRIYLSTNSPKYAGHIMFKCAAGDLDKLLYAAIDKAGKGTLFFYPLRKRLELGTFTKEQNTALVTAIMDISLDPSKVAKINGIKYNHCCFCGQELTNASSVYHGYGPTCAENYGLPWGDTDDEGNKLEDIA